VVRSSVSGFVDSSVSRVRASVGISLAVARDSFDSSSACWTVTDFVAVSEPTVDSVIVSGGRGSAVVSVGIVVVVSVERASVVDEVADEFVGVPFGVDVAFGVASDSNSPPAETETPPRSESTDVA
jgi:hypothetical protein